MLTLDYTPHFLLDDQDNYHCTSDLLKLSTDAFIWHELHRINPNQNILLLDTGDAGVQIKVFDSASRQCLIPQRAGLFSRSEELPPIMRSVLTLAELKTTEDKLLEKILTTAAKSNRQTALIIPHGLFLRLCRAGDDAVLRGLEKKCRLLIRLPADPGLLEALLREDFRDSQTLASVYKWLDSVRTDASCELLPAIKRTLGSQFILPDERYGEMRELLRLCAVQNSDFADSPEMMTAQAEYLELCRRRRVGLLRAPSSQDQFTRCTRQMTAAMLRDPNFRTALRSTVDEFRRAYPENSITDALASEPRPEAPPYPAYRDDLATKVLGLALPDEWAHLEMGNDCWDNKLYTIKRRLCTVWNHPRNPEIIKTATQLCVRAQSAITLRNQRSMEEILKLLDFFSSQICASRKLNDALNGIRDDGYDIIRLCEKLYQPNPYGSAEGITKIVLEGTQAADQYNLTMLQDLVGSAIAEFAQPENDQQKLTEKIIGARTRLHRQLESNQEILRRYAEDQELRFRKEELLNGLGVSDESTLEPEDGVLPETDPDEPLDPNNYWNLPIE